MREHVSGGSQPRRQDSENWNPQSPGKAQSRGEDAMDRRDIAPSLGLSRRRRV